VLVYWIPLIVFFIWWAVMCVVLRGAILRERADDRVVAAPTAAPVPAK
jgi:predicted secreted protein